MNLKQFILISSLVFFASCTEKQNTEQLASSSTAKDIDVKTLFSSPQGEELFKTNCITCHSLRYIQMQPPFPRKTWEKIVDKMIKNFGAPIPDSSAKAIVEYLVKVKGKQ